MPDFMFYFNGLDIFRMDERGKAARPDGDNGGNLPPARPLLRYCATAGRASSTALASRSGSNLAMNLLAPTLSTMF